MVPHWIVRSIWKCWEIRLCSIHPLLNALRCYLHLWWYCFLEMLADTESGKGEVLLVVCSSTQDQAQSHDLGRKTHQSSYSNHLYLPPLYLPVSLAFVVGDTRESHCFSTLPMRLTDRLTEKTRSRIDCGRQKILWKRLVRTCATWADTLVAQLIFNGTVWARDVVRLASATKLGGGGNHPVVIEALPLSTLASLVAALGALTPRAPASPGCSGVPSWEKFKTRNLFTWSGITRCRTTRSGNSFINPGSHLINERLRDTY